MSERKGFPLRLPPALLDELARWAADDLRSVNAQIEFLLRDAIHRRRRIISEEAGESGEEGKP